MYIIRYTLLKHISISPFDSVAVAISVSFSTTATSTLASKHIYKSMHIIAFAIEV